MAVLAMQAQEVKFDNVVNFDTDAAPVSINNQASGCISNVSTNFIGPLTPSNQKIEVFGGTKTMNIQVGTLRWKWLDDQGVETKFDIPNSYYIPDGDVCLLSPQRWAKAVQDTTPGGTRYQMFANHMTLFWDGRKHQLTIPLGQSNNIGMFHLSLGFGKYDVFCQQAELQDDDAEPFIVSPAALVSDDEGDDNDIELNRNPTLDLTDNNPTPTILDQEGDQDQ